MLILLTGSVCFAQPESPGLELSDLSSDVTVRRDMRSIPYIEAANDNDLYFAQGFTTASDRLWQMDLLRRVALGETAEIFGKQTLEEDKRWRRFGFRAIADENVQYLSPELRAALESYSRGVNAYIATLDEKSLPIEFRVLQYRPRQWKPADSIVIGKILADALSSTWRTDLLRASLQGIDKTKLAELSNQVTPYDVVLFGTDSRPVKSLSAEGSDSVSDGMLAAANRAETIRTASLRRIGFYAEELAASNNWVISGKRTIDGKPILANDPHLMATAPGIWYLSHLSTPSMRVSGVTFPGVPGIVLGHNEHIAWGATNVGPDVQDLYLETFTDDGKYKTPDGTALPKVRKEEIKVRTSLLKTDVSNEVLEVVETRNGPIILEDGAKRYSLKWTAFDPKNSEFEAFFRANRAKNWDEFKSAFRTYGGATQNFVFADAKGNIGWYAAGKIPIRRTGDGALPYDGATTDGDWIGMIPFDELPHLYNPASGLIVTANQRIVGTDYKYQTVSRDAAGPWRARRIYDLLNNGRKVSMDNVSDVQADDFNIPNANLAREIVRLKAASEQTLDLLREWDGRMTADSQAALVVNEIRLCAANAIAAENKPVPAYLIRERILDQAVREQSAVWMPKRFADYTAFLRSCDSAIAADLTKRLGTDRSKWVWGSVFTSRFSHPLASAPFIGGQFATPSVPLGGSGQSANVGSSVSMRFVASPGNWDATRHVIPLGQSGDPASAHFKDQFESWRSGASSVFPFSKSKVEAAAVTSLTLRPKK